MLSRNPLKSGQCFLQVCLPWSTLPLNIDNSRNPLKSGQCFLRIKNVTKSQYRERDVAIPSNRVNVSYRKTENALEAARGQVAIPSNRVNVSYSTHLFLRIIGNLTPPFREPHYFYAFFFPI